MCLRLINLEKYRGVLTVPDHAKLAALLLEEQDFFKVATGTSRSSADEECDQSVVGSGSATSEGCCDGNESPTLASDDDNDGKLSIVKDGTASSTDRGATIDSSGDGTTLGGGVTERDGCTIKGMESPTLSSADSRDGSLLLMKDETETHTNCDDFIYGSGVGFALGGNRIGNQDGVKDGNEHSNLASIEGSDGSAPVTKKGNQSHSNRVSTKNNTSDKTTFGDITVGKDGCKDGKESCTLASDNGGLDGSTRVTKDGIDSCTAHEGTDDICTDGSLIDGNTIDRDGVNNDGIGYHTHASAGGRDGTSLGTKDSVADSTNHDGRNDSINKGYASDGNAIGKYGNIDDGIESRTRPSADGCDDTSLGTKDGIKIRNNHDDFTKGSEGIAINGNETGRDGCDDDGIEYHTHASVGGSDGTSLGTKDGVVGSTNHNGSDDSIVKGTASDGSIAVGSDGISLAYKNGTTARSNYDGTNDGPSEGIDIKCNDTGRHGCTNDGVEIHTYASNDGCDGKLLDTKDTIEGDRGNESPTLAFIDGWYGTSTSPIDGMNKDNDGNMSANSSSIENRDTTTLTSVTGKEGTLSVEEHDALSIAASNGGLVFASLLLKLRKMIKELKEKRLGTYVPIAKGFKVVTKSDKIAKLSKYAVRFRCKRTPTYGNVIKESDFFPGFYLVHFYKDNEYYYYEDKVIKIVSNRPTTHIFGREQPNTPVRMQSVAPTLKKDNELILQHIFCSKLHQTPSA